MNTAVLSQLRGPVAASALTKVPDSAKSDRSAANPALAGPDVRDDEAERWHYFFNAGAATWFEDIKDVTFSSTFCELFRDEAQIIVDHWKQRESETARLIREEDALLEENCSGYQHPVLDELFRVARQRLTPLVERLDAAIQEEIKKSSVGRAFVKLATRSPKDSKKALARAKLAYDARIQEMRDSGIDTRPNARWRVLSEEVTRAGSCRTAVEAIELLLDSARVFEDLEYALRGPPVAVSAMEGYMPETRRVAEEKQNESSSGDTLCWNMTLVARAWDPRLSPASELRGIVWNNELSCLCQYYHPLYFPELAANKELILNDVMATFRRDDVSKAITKIGGHCIVDFAWLEKGKVMIVELNPFDGVCLGTFPASTGLFSWDDEDGDRLVMKGEAPFEFRIRSAPLEPALLKNQCNPAWWNIVHG